MNEAGVPAANVAVHLRRVRRLSKHVWTHFREDRCFEEAASLSYTSLLSMVPLLAVIFGIVSVFPVFNEWSIRLQSFIFDNFLPDTGQQIVPYINSFLDSVSSLTLPGTLVLIVTALLLMVRIEVALNRVWRVDRSRSLTNRIVMYWAALTLAPLLIAAAVALSAQQLFGQSGYLGFLPAGLADLWIFLLYWLVFALLFVMVPNRSVKLRYAAIGALLSAVLFSLAKAGFVAYVSNTSYKVIYGALATVPLFLFWLYLVWVIVLLGASLAASLTTFSDFGRYESDWPKRWEFQLLFRLVGHLNDAQDRGATLSREQLMDLESGASELQIVRLLSQLRDEKIATRDEDGNWLLTRDLDDLTLGDLHSRGDFYLPLSEMAELPRKSARDRAYAALLERVRDHSRSVWDQPLAALYREGNDQEETS
jgi:membrane protein